jgi:predicted Zn-dependent protease
VDEFNGQGPIQVARLIRAYLEMGRYMEAMVVAKKAIRAFAPDICHRLLLAEVYEAQGKAARAVEVLEEAERAAPGDARVAEMLRRIRDP